MKFSRSRQRACFVPLLLTALLWGCASPEQPVSAPPAGMQSTTPRASAEAPSLAGWENVNLPGKKPTGYERDVKDGKNCWRADAEQSASMQRKRLHVPAERLGEVQFSWWVDALVPGADLSEAGQGDAPARMVFAFDGDHGRLSMRNRMLFELAGALSGEPPPYATLMYVWANEAQPDSVILNPRTDRIRKIVLESGPGHLKQWRHYKRDLAADFRRAFGEEPGALIGMAMMTDTDNTGSSTRAWYGDIHLSDASPRVVR